MYNARSIIMPKIAWDRLLETSFQRGPDLLFVPNSPPFIRPDSNWSLLRVPPVSSHDVSDMAAELMPVVDDELDGYAYRDISYGDVARFRLMAFGHPGT